MRRVKPDFGATEPPVWFGRDCFQGDFYNAYTLLLSDEREFTRIVRRFLPTTEDPRLREQLRRWLAQETNHGIQHTNAHAILEHQGLRHRLLLRALRFINYRVFARMLGPRLMLAVVAGLEHFNTMLAEMVLRDPRFLREADDQMALLLQWHLAEEIEHRAVVHDVVVAHGFGYWTRVLTGAIAFYFYTVNLFIVAWCFALQRGGVWRLSTYRSAFRFLFVDERFCSFLISYFHEYLRHDFHPLDRRTDELVSEALGRLSLTEPRDVESVAGPRGGSHGPRPPCQELT